MDEGALKSILRGYSGLISTERYQELYKWREVKRFQDNWNLDDPDFGGMMRRSFVQNSNLWVANQYFPLAMLLRFSEHSPEKLRAAFKALYDRQSDLADRVKRFQTQCDNLLADFDPSGAKQHYQDLRAICGYLAFRFPDECYLYKFGMHKTFAAQVKSDFIPRKGGVDAYLKYTELAETVKSALRSDGELLRAHQARLTPDCYPDLNLNLLTQDIIYCAATYLAKGQTGQDPVPASTTKTKSMHHSLNVILCGAPGTGKTYSLVERALNIVHEDERYSQPKARTDLMAEFRSLREAGQISFITFHQSYSYEEFVEGIRPGLTDQQVQYELHDGPFKEMVNRALVGYTSSAVRYAFDPDKVEFYKMSLGDSTDPDDSRKYEYCLEKGVVGLGWGGTIDFTGARTREQVAEKYKGERDRGGSPYAVQAIDIFSNWMKRDDLVLISRGNLRVRAIGRITGDYEYRRNAPIDFHHFRNVEWLVRDVDIPINSISRKRISQQTVYQFYKKDLDLEAIAGLLSGKGTAGAAPKKYVFIIDEINRANISRVFGELITLIEPDKRLGATNEVRVSLPYSNEEFVIPPNVHILGTMNTADRSIALIDTALRRRFTFVTLDPDPHLVENPSLRSLLSALNLKIMEELGPDFCIGHSYFMGKTEADLPALMNESILPLLSEYFYNDNGKIRDIFNGTGQESRLTIVNGTAGNDGKGRLRFE